MDSKYNDPIKIFLLSFRRLYVVNAIKGGQMKLAMDYLKNNSSNLVTESEGIPDSDWSPWFSIPFINQPQNDKRFIAYFSPSWETSVKTSFTNFLSTIFMNVQLPKLIELQSGRLENRKKESELFALHSKVLFYENNIAILNAQLQNLEKKGSEFITIFKNNLFV